MQTAKTPKPEPGPAEAMCFMAGLCNATGKQHLADLCLIELAAFLSVHEQMGIERQPNPA